MAAFHSSLDAKKVPKWMSNHFPLWRTFLSKLGPEDLLLRPAIDRSGRKKAWQRILVEHAASTTGLLGIYTAQINNCREPEPALVEDALGHWLDSCLRDETWELSVPLQEKLGKAYTAAGSTAPASMCCKLLGHRSSLWIQPFFHHEAGHVSIHLSSLFEAMLQEGQCSTSHVSLSKLLPALQKHYRLEWLYRALLYEVARQIDMRVHLQQLSSNPMDGDRVWGGRTDPDLTAHLCSGLGSTEGSAHIVAAHVAAFTRLRKPHKRWGKQKDPKHKAHIGQRMQLCRYLESCRSFLKDCHEFCIAYDASRIGGKEVLLLVLLATSHNEHTKACWAPPQVSALVCL